jgi:hypothetical protein
VGGDASPCLLRTAYCLLLGQSVGSCNEGTWAGTQAPAYCLLPLLLDHVLPSLFPAVIQPEADGDGDDDEQAVPFDVLDAAED